MDKEYNCHSVVSSMERHDLMTPERQRRLRKPPWQGSIVSKTLTMIVLLSVMFG